MFTSLTIVSYIVVLTNFLLSQRQVSHDMITSLTAINQTAPELVWWEASNLGIFSYHADSVLPQEVVVPSSGFSYFFCGA